jgi:hypothetical protein
MLDYGVCRIRARRTKYSIVIDLVAVRQDAHAHPSPGHISWNSARTVLRCSSVCPVWQCHTLPLANKVLLRDRRSISYNCPCRLRFCELPPYRLAGRLFAMVVQSLYLADLQKVSGHLERKICAVGATRCLTESPKMLSDYKDLWYVRSLTKSSPFAGPCCCCGSLRLDLFHSPHPSPPRASSGTSFPPAVPVPQYTSSANLRRISLAIEYARALMQRTPAPLLQV